MARVKEALAKSDESEAQAAGVSWRVFKGVEPGPGGNIVYVWFINPPVKDEEYSVTDDSCGGVSRRGAGSVAKYIACFVDGQTMLNLPADGRSMRAIAAPK